MWVAVDKKDEELAYHDEPVRRNDWNTWVGDYDDTGVVMPTGSIERLLGRKLTWEDEPVEITNLK